MQSVTNLTNIKAKHIAKIMYAIACFCTVGSFLLPIPLAFKIPLALGLIVAFMHTGACIIYFNSLHLFTHRLRVAYRVVCAGSIFIAAGTIQLLVVNALGWQQVDWVAYGGTELPILVGLFLAFVGYSRFADLLAVRSGRQSPLIVAVLCTACLLFVPFLPHVPKLYPELGLDISMSMSAMHSVILLSGIILLFVMKRRAGPLYTPALAWTLLAFIFGLLSTGQQFFEYLFLADDHWYVVYRFYTICIGISGIFSLKAALLFSAIPSASELPVYTSSLTFFGKQRQLEQEKLSYIDIVTFASGLASDVRAIDPFLDPMRVITASLGSAKELTLDNKRALAKAYCQLEDYLATKELVRTYNREELRQLIKGRFEGQLDQAEFWQLVAQNRQNTPG